MGKKFYVILFSILSVSVILLGFSYAKESGTNEGVILADYSNDLYRVIYSSKILDTINSNKTDISLINKKNEVVNYSLVLSEVDNKEYNDVYYKIDNDEKLLVNGIIDLGELKAFGTDGDHITKSVSIYSKSNKEYTFKLEVKEIDKNLFKNVIKASKGVYTDNSGNVRYYGNDPMNFIKYNDEMYRIIGLINNKVRIISNIKGLGAYDTSKDNYPTLEDYFGSFNNSNVGFDNVINYTSWMSDKGYWLNELDGDTTYFASKINGVGETPITVDYYLRYVYEIDSTYQVIKGDGSWANPYEVAYGSK